MARVSKFLKLQEDVLLEWIYDEDNFYSENYTIINNLNTKERDYVSDTTINNINNNLFTIDPVIRRYSVIDPVKFPFLQKQKYFTSPVVYDVVKIHFPLNYDFISNNNYGFNFQVRVKDYYNNNFHNLSNYYFDYTDPSRTNELNFGIPFFYDEQQWGKYIQFSIPSANYVSNQRVYQQGTSNVVEKNSLNDNLTNGIGISKNNNIYINYSWINSIQTTFGTKYYNLSEDFKLTIPMVPEYQTLAVQINENENFDYFEIYGTYNGDKEQLDDFVDELVSMGRRIRIEYDVLLYEENIFQGSQTFVVTENFTKPILYRPIITFSNTTAYIQVVMRIIDLVDKSTITRISSIGLTKNIFKYGLNLTRININNAYKPKIYNLKGNRNTQNKNIDVNSSYQNTNFVKVNYPVLIDRYYIVTGSANSTTSGKYKGIGLLEIILSPFDNIIKFNIAKLVNTTQIDRYDLSDILNNSKLNLIFQSDNDIIEKEIFYESNDNDYSNGIVVYKIEEQDLKTIKTISKDNSNFYLILKNQNTKTKTMLYSGTFVMYDEVKFVEQQKSSVIESQVVENNNGVDFTNTNTLENKNLGTNSNSQTPVVTANNQPSDRNVRSTNITVYKSLMVFVKRTLSDQNSFDKAISRIIDVKKHLYTKYNFTYFFVGLTDKQIQSILRYKKYLDEKGTQIIGPEVLNPS